MTISTGSVPVLLASIPSPPGEDISLGPLTLRAYGMMIALGVLAAVWLSQKRWRERGGHPDDVTSIAMWAVPAGLIGARLYHVLTDWRSFHDNDRWGDVWKIWEGGLGIPGGMALGIVVGVWYVRKRGWSMANALDATVPSLPLAQAIGRWGNWFNQELYGTPSDLPWAVEIDTFLIARRTPQYDGVATTFHPTFLYESLWNFALVALMLVIDRKRVLKPGRLIGVYLVGYGIGRLWIELLRTDTASLLWGVRVNVWMSLALIAGGALTIFMGGLRFGDGDGTDDQVTDDQVTKDDPRAADGDADDTNSDDTDTDDTDSDDTDPDDTDTDEADPDEVAPGDPDEPLDVI